MEDKQQAPVVVTNLEKPRRKQLLSRVWLIVSLVAVLLVVVGAVLAATGLITVKIGQTQHEGQVAVNTEAVCVRSDVLKYNELFTKYPTTQEESSAFDKTIVDFGNSVRQKSNYETDPTCLYFVYTGEIRKGDKTKAAEALDKLEALVERGLYIDSRVTNIQSVGAMRQAVETPELPAGNSELFNTGG